MADPEKFFTEPHYNGFPAVLVRLPAVTAAELRQLLGEAYRCQAPREPAARAKPRAALKAVLKAVLKAPKKPKR